MIHAPHPFKAIIVVVVDDGVAVHALLRPLKEATKAKGETITLFAALETRPFKKPFSRAQTKKGDEVTLGRRQGSRKA
jgi:hypothetical protein